MSLTWILVAAIVIVAVVLFLLRDRIRGKAVPSGIKPGNPLPEFSALDEDGNAISSTELSGRPTVLLFVRGSWCPFCSKQVHDLTRYYKEINDAGARLIFVTPKPLDTTRRVAELFNVDFEFWRDGDLAIGRELGLVHDAGVPGKQRAEFGTDTLWPTSLIVDADGVIRHTELSRFIADRPNPEKLLRIVQAL